MSLDQAKQALIALAVNDLAHDNEYDSITVDMICDRASISRSGFYRAFESKYDVLLWCERFPLERGLAEMGRTLTCADGIEVAIRGFEMFADMFHSTSNSTERRRRESDGIKRVYGYIRETLSEHHGMRLDDELDYQALWCARGTLLSIRDRREQEWDPATLAQRIAACYPPRIAEALNSPITPAVPDFLDFKSLVLG